MRLRMPFYLSIAQMFAPHGHEGYDFSKEELFDLYAMLCGFIATAPKEITETPLLSAMKKLHGCIEAFIVPGDRAELAKLVGASGHAKNELSEGTKEAAIAFMEELLNKTIDNL
jgi:hypothetical protein